MSSRDVDVMSAAASSRFSVVSATSRARSKSSGGLSLTEGENGAPTATRGRAPTRFAATLNPKLIDPDVFQLETPQDRQPDEIEIHVPSNEDGRKFSKLYNASESITLLMAENDWTQHVSEQKISGIQRTDGWNE